MHFTPGRIAGNQRAQFHRVIDIFAIKLTPNRQLYPIPHTSQNKAPPETIHHSI